MSADLPPDDVPLSLLLLQRARSGDATARDQLFARCRNYLSLLARAQVEGWMRRKVDASDLIQQTLLDAYQDFANFRGETEAEWLAWLRRILAHNSQDFVRRFRTDKRNAGKELDTSGPLASGVSDAFIDPADPEAATASQILMQRERELELAEAILELEPDYQEVIQLRHLQQLPFNEVAERMERSRPAVQMLWLRALKRLEERLATRQRGRSPS